MIVNVQEIKTYYEAAGEGQPVLLLHGWGADAGSLRGVSKLVRESISARAIALDFPGFGFSDHPAEPWDVSRYEKFFEAFLDSLGIQKVTVIAHSFGGRVAIKFAAACPERMNRLVLVDSAGIRPQRKAGWYLRVGTAKTIRFIREKTPGLARVLHLDQLAARQGSEDYRKAGDMRQTFNRVVNEDLRVFLPLIRCSTLLIWGQLDDATPLSDAVLMHDMIRGSRLEVIPGAGHFSFADRFGDFSRILISFLKEPV